MQKAASLACMVEFLDWPDKLTIGATADVRVSSQLFFMDALYALVPSHV
jgi:hypothetical protein